MFPAGIWVKSSRRWDCRGCEYEKELTKRIIDGFSYAVAINVVVALICILVFKIEPLVPSYSAYFENKSMALLVQIILTGVISGTFAGGTVLFEQAKLGLLLQSLLYFLLTTAVCIPITGFCWGLFVYKPQPSFSCAIILPPTSSAGRWHTAAR